MLAVKKHKPEVNKDYLIFFSKKTNINLEYLLIMIMKTTFQIWDRVVRLMDHLEERRAEDK